MPFGLQLWEILLVLVLALLIFGPKKLPEMGRSLGRGMREFRDSISGREDREDLDDREDREDRRIDVRADDDAPVELPAARERDSVS
jgi:sec-independent protein translocase protein TatA